MAEGRKTVLITGGAGTIGQAFIERHRDEYDFVNLSRGEAGIHALERRFPEIRSFVCDVNDADRLINVFLKVRPDVVVHAAALKHVNYAEMNPSKTVEVNIVGGLNVVRACVRAEVPIAVGISTDKACQPENIYGYSKKILEQTFLEHHNRDTRFVCARFANVAASSGSVIPFWIDAARAGQHLKLTDSRMNRLMFTRGEAAALIRQAIDFAGRSEKPFVLCRTMKSVSMLQLANVIAQEFGPGGPRGPDPRFVPPIPGSVVEVVGLRPGERLNEVLVSQRELPQASLTDDGRHIALFNDDFGRGRVTSELSSLTADHMTNDEIMALFADYGPYGAVPGDVAAAAPAASPAAAVAEPAS